MIDKSYIENRISYFKSIYYEAIGRKDAPNEF